MDSLEAFKMLSKTLTNRSSCNDAVLLCFCAYISEYISEIVVITSVTLLYSNAVNHMTL